MDEINCIYVVEIVVAVKNIWVFDPFFNNGEIQMIVGFEQIELVQRFDVCIDVSSSYFL